MFNNFQHIETAMLSTPKPAPHKQNPFIGFRAEPKLKERSVKAQQKTGLTESEIVRTALIEFFEAHPTADKQIAAVIRCRSKTA